MNQRQTYDGSWYLLLLLVNSEHLHCNMIEDLLENDVKIVNSPVCWTILPVVESAMCMCDNACKETLRDINNYTWNFNTEWTR